MKVLLNISLFLLSSLLLISCEEIIELPLESAEPLIVIEGKINDAVNRQEVLISEMQSFSADSRRKPITNAEVLVNKDGGSWRKLREVEAGRYIIDNFRGKPGETYNLSVKYKGATYSAQSTMPQLVKIDSIGYRINDFDDSRRIPIISYQDPPNVKNYYFCQLIINGEVNTSLFISNDKYTDGKIVRQSLNDFDLELLDNALVKVELRNIDEASFNYCKSIQSQNGS